MTFRHKDSLCCYCGKKPATTDDHVLARGFLPKRKRANLPKVSACSDCNNQKSYVEDYLTSMLILGGRHPDAMELMTTVMPGRLEKNQRLAREIAIGLKANVVITPSGETFVDRGKIRIDNSKYRELAIYIAIGLARHCLKVFLGRDDVVRYAAFLSPEGVALVDKFAGDNLDVSVDDDFGDGAFIFVGQGSSLVPTLTHWRMELYGARLTGDTRLPGLTIGAVDVLTGPADCKPLLDLLVTLQKKNGNVS